MMGEPFYANGLRFSCTRCSSCCRYDSGYVFLSEADATVLAAALKIEYTDFIEQYCRWVGAGAEERLSLNEKADFDCIFWDAQCSVYQHRPLQCRTFPFWHSLTHSAATWADAGRGCLGINRGALHGRKEIEDCLADRTAEKIITRGKKGGGI